jgi:hypothetical protein
MKTDDSESTSTAKVFPLTADGIVAARERVQDAPLKQPKPGLADVSVWIRRSPGELTISVLPSDRPKDDSSIRKVHIEKYDEMKEKDDISEPETWHEADAATLS